jgi:gliding motility-associated-like protein
MRLKKYFLVFVFLLATVAAFAQACPTNISFEDGTFTNWKCYAGDIDRSGTITLGAPVAAVGGRHTMWQNSSPQIKDPYGDFPVNCPNGSKYSIQLGNAQGGHQAESVSYTYTIPADKQSFTIVYYYAVVLQTPGHQPFEQPAFQASITDISTGAVISPPGAPKSYRSDLSCGNHVFTASAGLAGFQVSKIDKGVVYKDWSPVVINLEGYAGHTIKMDFTTNDCVYSAHFGYAYLDFNDICDPLYDGLIVGNKFCAGSTNMILTAPAGFETYTWYDGALTTPLGQDHTLKIDPLPADGTKYALVVTPYLGLGCVDTFYTTVKKVEEAFSLKVAPNIEGCRADGVDITQAYLTAGSSPGLKYEYYVDPDGQIYLSDPKLVKISGTYYIRGSNAFGCTDVAPIVVQLYEGPALVAKDPTPVCFPATVDLTKAVTTTDAGVVFGYYSDLTNKVLIPNPKVITKTGTYYVTGVSPGVACTTVKEVNIIISALPVITTKQLKGCPPLNLTAVIDPETAGQYNYNYYSDAAGKVAVADPTKITVSGTYYYKAINYYGCEGNLAPITVMVYAPPVFTVTDPEPVVYPRTVNLMDTHLPLSFADFTYWKDAAATIPLDDYQTIGVSGTFYIKAINVANCVVINPVHVLVNAPPEPNLVVSNTFSPNGDGVNDEFRPTTVGAIKLNYIKVFNRYGIQVFETRQLLDRWDGNFNGKPEPSGTYYWVFSCYDNYRKKEYVRSGPITIIR